MAVAGELGMSSAIVGANASATEALARASESAAALGISGAERLRRFRNSLLERVRHDNGNDGSSIPSHDGSSYGRLYPADHDFLVSKNLRTCKPTVCR